MRVHRVIDRELVLRLARIEEKAYPPAYRYIRSMEDVEELLEYCEASYPDELIVLTGDNWYMVINHVSKEVIDWAAAGRLSMADLAKIWRFIKENFDELHMDAREKTSYKIMKVFEGRGRIEILHDSSWTWAGEIFHHVHIRIKSS